MDHGPAKDIRAPAEATEAVTVSVVIPTCDRPAYLAEAIGSVLAQTAPVGEIIVVDNGRTALDAEAVRSKGGSIRLVRATPLIGVAQARNIGAVLASGGVLAFLDDDDRWDPSYLEACLSALREGRCDIALGRLRDMASRRPLPGMELDFADTPELLARIHVENPGVVGSNVVISREAFFRGPGYDPYLTTGEDKAMVADLVRDGATVVRVDGAWVDFRTDTEGPRETHMRKRLRGKLRYTLKYWPIMSLSERRGALTGLLKLLVRAARG